MPDVIFSKIRRVWERLKAFCKEAVGDLARLADGKKTYFLCQVQLFGNALVALGVFPATFDFMVVSNAVLAVLILVARAYARKKGFLAVNPLPPAA